MSIGSRIWANALLVDATPCLVIPISYGYGFHTRVLMKPRTVKPADDDHFGMYGHSVVHGKTTDIAGFT